MRWMGVFGALCLAGAAWGQGAPASAPSAPAPSAPAPARLPAELFARLPFMEAPSLSPDGTKVAALVAVEGTQRLIVWPLADSSKMTAIAPGDNDLNWFRWVNDDWLVAGVGASQTYASDVFYIRRAIGISADGRTMRPIAWKEAAQGADDVIWVANDGSPRILLSVQKSIYLSDESFWPQVLEADVSTGRVRQVVRPHREVMDWYADANGAVRMGMGYDDDRGTATLLYRDGAAGLFRTLARARTRKGEELTVPALFLPEPGKALAFSDKDGFNALYELDLSTLELGRKVFGADGYDLDRLFTDRTGAGLAGVRWVDDRARVRWFDPELATVQTEMEKSLRGRRAEIVSMSRDRTRLIVRVGSASTPDAFYTMDTTDGVMRLLASSNEGFKGVRMGPVRTIRYKARDGLEIPAILTLPPGREAKGLPLIVMPHGGPAVRDEEGWDWWAQFLANRGYAVIQPNYRGSTGFGTDFARKGDGEWGLKMQDDLNDAVAHLASTGVADRTRVCMVGGSYGGYAALRAAQRDGKAYRCAVSFAGVSDLAHLARYDSRSIYGRSARAYLKNKAPDFRAVSPLHQAASFSAPVLLVHGKKDLRVPVWQSREMAERLRKAGKPVEYVEQPRGDHHFSRAEDRLQFLQLLEAFLAKHNPA